MSSVNEGFVPRHCSGELFLECPEISEISSGFFLVVMVRAHLAQPCHDAEGVLTADRKCTLFSEITQKNGLGHMVVIFNRVGHCEIDFMKFVKHLWAFIGDCAKFRFCEDSQA